MIKPYLRDLINENKAIETSSDEWKIQINTHIIFVSSNDTGEIVLFLCGVIMKELS